MLHLHHEKVKMKSVCLIKYHAMKMYPVLNYALFHEDIRESGGTAPHIFNPTTRWM
jgi:hypothetical protein